MTNQNTQTNVATLGLTTISPMFLYGANNRDNPEPRAASVRGQIRYWLRTLEGAKTADLSQIWTRETRTFGSTQQGSPVSVRFYSSNPGTLKIKEYEMLPHRNSSRDRSPQWALSPDQTFYLQLVTRPGIEINAFVRNAVQVWLLVGGLGKRSRRMFGGFDLAWANISDSRALAAAINERIKVQVKTPPSSSTVPLFPTLHPDHSRILVGTEGKDSHEELVVDLFQNLLRNNTLRQGEYIKFARTFGYAMQGRRASPLIAQARKLNGKFYPVLTFMRSKPEQDVKWTVLEHFMEDATNHYRCIDAWGNWGLHQ